MSRGHKAAEDMRVGSVHDTSQFGSLVIISYDGFYNVAVKFINTGYETVARVDSIRNGAVRDRLMPSVSGVGFIGDGAFDTNSQPYRNWVGMMKRCYTKKRNKKNSVYEGCTVCEDWHNFQNFAEWFISNKPESKEGERLEVDKDIKVSGNRIYGPEFCSVVTPSQNMQEVGDRALAKDYEFISPDGEFVKLRNLRRFCRENNLERSCMDRVFKGLQPYHKGWTRVINGELVRVDDE